MTRFTLLVATVLLGLLASATASVSVAGAAGGSGGSLTSGTGTRAVPFTAVTSNSGSSVVANSDLKTFTVDSKGTIEFQLTGTVSNSGCSPINSQICIYRTDTSQNVYCYTPSSGAFELVYAYYAPASSTYEVTVTNCSGGTVGVSNVALTILQAVSV
jgi:hypothetical protein